MATALHFPLRPVTATVLHFPLRPGWAILQPAVAPAMAKADCPAGFVRLAREMDSHRVVVAASFGARFSPAPDLSAAVPSGVCRCPIRFATVGFVPAAGPFDLVVAVAVVAGLSAADLSVVAPDPGSGGSVVVAVAADLACSAYFSAAELGKEKAVALAFCFLTYRSSFCRIRSCFLISCFFDRALLFFC